MRSSHTSRTRKITLGLFLILLASGVFAAPALAKDPSVSTLKQRLRHARQMQLRSHDRVSSAAANLAGARELAATVTSGTALAETATLADPGAVVVPAAMSPTLAATLLADGVVSDDEVAALQSRLAAAKRVAHRWDVKVRTLKKRVRQLHQIARWNSRSQWKPLIAIAAARYGVSEAGLYRMMMLESSGQRNVSSGPYHGLYQFMYREWAMSWNEWRDHSIYDGWSQIQLAAKCIGRGMGPSIWPLTYRMSF